VCLLPVGLRPLAPAPRRGLRVAVRAQEPEVSQPVVRGFAVDVVHGLRQRRPAPRAVASADRAHVLHTALERCAHQRPALRPGRAGWSPNQHLLLRLAAAGPAPVDGLPEEVGRVQPRAPTDVAVRAASRLDAEAARGVRSQCVTSTWAWARRSQIVRRRLGVVGTPSLQSRSSMSVDTAAVLSSSSCGYLRAAMDARLGTAPTVARCVHRRGASSQTTCSSARVRMRSEHHARLGSSS
jgi:hypothetical protein